MTLGGSGDQGGPEIEQFEMTALARSDVDTLMLLFQPLAVRFAIAGTRCPMSHEMVEGWIIETTNPSSRPGRLVHGLREDGTLKILTVLENIDWLHRSATLTFIPTQSGQSEQTQQAAVAYLVHLAFCDLGLHRLETRLTPGAQAYDVYKSQGFKQEGRRRAACFRDGNAQDLLVLAKLNSGTADAPMGSALSDTSCPNV